MRVMQKPDAYVNAVHIGACSKVRSGRDTASSARRTSLPASAPTVIQGYSRHLHGSLTCSTMVGSPLECPSLTHAVTM